MEGFEVQCISRPARRGLIVEEREFEFHFELSRYQGAQRLIQMTLLQGWFQTVLHPKLQQEEERNLRQLLTKGLMKV